MPRLLISVRNAAEALDALSGGADLIDIKEPRQGSLGAAPETVWEDVCAVVAGRCPVSVALGELLDYSPGCSSFPHDVRFAKLGLAGCSKCTDWTHRWSRAIKMLPDHIQPVAVIYADAEAAEAPGADDVINYGLQHGCKAILVDTFVKTTGNLFDVLPAWKLRDIVRFAHARDMTVVLGGSLDERTLPQAQGIAPDYVAFRGAVCRGSRTGSVERVLVGRLAKQLATVSS